MLNRQKTILQLLKKASRPISGTELTKWSFLLRHEFDSHGGNAFYDFVPYKLGPFSFALYQELDKLHTQNYVNRSGEHCWTIGEVAPPLLPNKSVVNDVTCVVQRFGNLSYDSLLDYVYERHPEFTVNSERKQLAKRPTVSPAVFTAGYEGISIDRFLHLLVQHGIERLIDVRRNPTARRYGFHKSTLDRLTSKLSIEYIHVPELGIHSVNRQNLNSLADRGKLFAEYEATTLKTEIDAVSFVARLVKEKPSVLVLTRGGNHSKRNSLTVSQKMELG